ncbi:MAG: tetratricopeptide repeat protein [Candidatus Omnitrophica bacterium]|nr:tetratricopeptide repeat protein [Candidatus Omnitrophota bacterium]
MKRKLNIILGTLILSAAFLLGLKSAGNVVAYRALEQGDYAKALELYALDGDYSGQGMAYCAMKQYDEAIRIFEKAKNDSGVGLAYCGKRDFDKAITYFEKDKNNSALGLAYCGKKDYAEAKNYFSKANDYSGMGLALLGEKKYDEANDYFKRAKDNNGLGLVLLAEQKFDEALAHFKRYKNNSGIGMALLGKKKYEEAELYFAKANDYSGLSLIFCGKKEFDTAISFALKANDLSALSYAYCGKNEFDRAIEYAEKANDFSALGHAYCGKRKFERAIEYFRQANDNSGLSFAYCGKKDFDRAVEYAEKANDFSALGHAYCGKKEFEKALIYFEEANDASGLGLIYCGKKDFSQAMRYANIANDNKICGLIYCGKREFERAIEYFQQANDDAGLSLAYSGKKEFDRAIEYAKKANDFSALGHAYCGKKEFDKAIEYFIKANDDSGLSFVYSGKREFDKAMQYAKKANDFSAMGGAYCGKKEFDAALSCFQQANDDSGLSLACSGKKDFDKAIEYAKKANDLSALGHAYCGKKDFDKAIEYFRQANDDSGLSFAYCGKREFDLAFSYAQKANDLSAMGHIYNGKRQFDEAIYYFEQANDDSGLSLAYCGKREYDTAIVYAQMANDLSAQGYIYCGKKEFDKAIECFIKANDDSGLSFTYCGKNNHEQALEYAKKANDLSAQGHAYLQKHDYKRALESFTKANDKSGIGFVYTQQKEYEKALPYAQEANDISLMGYIRLGLGNKKDAESCFSLANDLSGLGHLKLEDKKNNEALELFKQANDLHGQGFVYMQMERYEEAWKCFDSANDYSGLGRLALERKDYQQAILFFEKANDYDGLGDVYWKLRCYDKAAYDFKIEGNELKAVQALRKKEDGGIEEALIYAEKTIEEGKFVYALSLEAAKIYISQKEYEKAVEELERVLNSDSYYANEALMLLGKVRYLERKYDLAEKAFIELTERYPESCFFESAKKAIETLKYLQNIEEAKEKKNKEKGIVLTPKNRCGPDSLSILLAFQGLNVEPEEIAALAGTDEEGTTMFGLKQAAREKGVELLALKFTPRELLNYEGKAILLVNENHFVVLKEHISDDFFLIDGTEEKKMFSDELLAYWKGEVLAQKPLIECKQLTCLETKTIKGGTEGGTTKGDPGIKPNGAWHMDMGNIGPIVSKGLSKAMPHLFPGLKEEGWKVLLDNANNWIGGGNCEQPVDPVCVTSGKLVLPFVDIMIEGRGRNNGMALRMERSYSSASTLEGSFGFGWQGYHWVCLSTPAPTNTDIMVVTFPDGLEMTYRRLSNGTYTRPNCDASELVETTGGDFIWKRWTSRYGYQNYYFSVTWEYYPSGSICTTRLEYIEDQNGNRLTYQHSGDGRIERITDNSGRYLEFVYDSGSGKVERINSPAGTYNYYYDSNGNLIEVTGPENYRWRYEYNDPNSLHNITAVIDSNGYRTEYQYDAYDRCVKVITEPNEPANSEPIEAVYDYNIPFGVTTVTDTRGRVTIYEYDTGSITRIIDSNAGETLYMYDLSYRHTGKRDVNGNITLWTNDPYGNCTGIRESFYGQPITTMSYHPKFHKIETITDAKGRITTYTYDEKGNLKTKDEPGTGGSRANTTYNYDGYGNLTKVTDPEGIETNYEYDAYGNVTKIIDGEGSYVEYEYDAANNLTKSRSGDAAHTTEPWIIYEYDGRSRLKITRYPDASYEQYTYDNNGNILTFRDANGHISTYAYNRLNQCIYEEDAENKITQYEYDAFDNVTKIIRNTGGRDIITRMEYDDHYNRVTKVIDPEQEITEYDYTGTAPILYNNEYAIMRKYKSDGTPLAVETRIYDRWYQLKEIHDGLNQITRFDYDKTGNLISLEDPKTHKTIYDFDPNANVCIKETNPLQKQINYTYYKNAKLKSKTDSKNQTINYEYDLAGRLEKISYPDASSVEYQYNQYGKISQVIDSRGLTTYFYDNRGRLTQVDGPQANDNVSYTYDHVGNRSTMTVAVEGTYNYTYYDNNLPYTITNPQNQTTTFTYDMANRCVRMEYANGTKTEWSYYDNDNIQSLTVKNLGQQILSGYAYEYNTLNQLVKVTDKDNNTYNYVYDDAGQLLHEDKKDAGNAGIYFRDYGYDITGNRMAENRDGQNITYVSNDWNQIISRTSSSESISYQYDDNGNLTREISSVSGTKTYSYDYENRLSTVSSPQSTVNYSYSGDGRRISSNTNGTVVKYIYDAMVPVAERDSAGVTLAAYTKIPGAPGGIGGLISSTDGTNTVYYHCAHLGNVNQITDATGAVIQTHDYDAFGNIVSQSGFLTNAYSYKTKEYSANTGLVYFGARYYDSLTGRFITADPLGMVDGTNVYLYCGNDPINIYDPYGECWTDINWKTFGLGVFGILSGIGEFGGGIAMLSVPEANVFLGIVGYGMLQTGSSSIIFGFSDIMGSFQGKEPIALQIYHGTPGIPYINYPNMRDGVKASPKKGIDIPYWWDRA